MALTFPLPLAYLGDTLPIQSIRWSQRRNDELSGTGDGRVWVAELAPPLWQAEITLARRVIPVARQIEAKLRALRGSREAFYLVDPIAPYPAADPDGTLLGGAAVTLSGVAAGRFALSLAGLPSGYALTPGDKLQVAFGARTYFGEVSESKTATSGGAIADIAVTPALPAGVLVGASVRLARPYLKAIIAPGTYGGGLSARIHTDGITFTALEKK